MSSELALAILVTIVVFAVSAAIWAAVKEWRGLK